MEQLPIFLNTAGKPVILLGEGEAADAKRRLIERAGGVPVGEDNDVARVGIVAIEDEEEAVAAVKRLKARGLLVNAVDRPALCDFTTPAIIDRAPVLVAIGTGGASAGLAKALRQRLETLLPVSLGPLASALERAREAMRARWPAGHERRRAIDAALGAGGVLDPLADQPADAVTRWLEGGTTGQAPGVFTIHLRSDDPEDLSLRELRLLGSADRLLHEAGVPAAIVARARADAAVRLWSGDAVDAAPGEVVICLKRAPAENS